jgi:hypothetical protein
MKRYELISEIEARTIEEGSTVSLVPGGLITPLAKDTLTARGVKVVRDGQLDETDASLAPVSEIRRVAVGSDHTGIALRQIVVRHLRAKALAVDDQGTDSTASVDYPDIAGRVAFAVAMGEADAGIVYISDAVAVPELSTIEIPTDFNVVARYPIAALAGAPQPDLAVEFIAYVLSLDGQAILLKWGFSPIAP